MGEAISFFSQYMDFSTPLPKRRILHVKSMQALNGDTVTPILCMQTDNSLALLRGAINGLGMKQRAREISVPIAADEKYRPKIH
jgi:hypothetical protein